MSDEIKKQVRNGVTEFALSDEQTTALKTLEHKLALTTLETVNGEMVPKFGPGVALNMTLEVLISLTAGFLAGLSRFGVSEDEVREIGRKAEAGLRLRIEDTLAEQKAGSVTVLTSTGPAKSGAAGINPSVFSHIRGDA